jgi:hypothetical protein
MTDNVKVTLQWPHTALKYDMGQQQVAYNDLDLAALVVGELTIISSDISPTIVEPFCGQTYSIFMAPVSLRLRKASVNGAGENPFWQSRPAPFTLKQVYITLKCALQLKHSTNASGFANRFKSETADTQALTRLWCRDDKGWLNTFALHVCKKIAQHAPILRRHKIVHTTLLIIVCTMLSMSEKNIKLNKMDNFKPDEG